MLNNQLGKLVAKLLALSLLITTFCFTQTSAFSKQIDDPYTRCMGVGGAYCEENYGDWQTSEAARICIMEVYRACNEMYPE